MSEPRPDGCICDDDEFVWRCPVHDAVNARPAAGGQPPRRKTPIKRSTKRIKGRRGDPAKRRWARHRDPDFLKWIKEQVCAICGKWPVDPAHLRKRSLGSDDRDNVIPLCRWHHDEQEDHDAEFEAKYHISLPELAHRYTARYGSGSV